MDVQSCSLSDFKQFGGGEESMGIWGFVKYTPPCQNVPAAGNFATFSQLLVAYSTLDFTMSPLAGKGTWCLLPTTPSMLPTATKHFDRAAHTKFQYAAKSIIK